MSSRLNIVVGVTGGIAAYKTVTVIRELVLAGHHVQVIATENALRFVGMPTFEAISRNPVHSDLYSGVSEVRHVALGQAADVIIVAPATANSLAKLASGLADDLLGNTILASRAPLVIAPAMHTEMWSNPATEHNVATLRDRGAIIVGPGVGKLTGDDVGAGRMSEPDEIVDAALASVGPRDLDGIRILVTAGGTREPLDPVRFIGNRSSGKQGCALAAAAHRRGATVCLIAANLEIEPPTGVRVVRVQSNDELAEAVSGEASEHDTIIMAAAVADYRPVSVAEAKMSKRADDETMSLRLEKTPDILALLSAHRRDDQIIVGFGAETEPNDEKMIELGRAKLLRKGCDYLVVNRVGWSEGFTSDSNSAMIIDRGGAVVATVTGSKLSVADHILDVLIAR